MATNSAWSSAEIAATVGSYFRMLKLELASQPFNKSAENAKLRDRLDNRSKGAVEFKHQNISAALLENGWIYIEGYKPMRNLQSELRNAVETRLRLDSDLDELMSVAANRPFAAEYAPAGLPKMEDPPEFVLGKAEWTPRITGIKRDYVFSDTRDRALGMAGELRAMEYEKHRLASAGRVDLSERVEHVALTQGDGLGYDILSFETNSSERFVEVKTTLYSATTPFFVSSNEVEASDFYGDNFRVHRLYQFATKPKMYSLAGSLREACQLEPINFRAAPKAVIP